MKQKVFTITFLLMSLMAFSQNDDLTISADRPGMATGPDVMPFRKVQMEMGFETSHSNTTSVLLPTVMLRYGMTQFAELRVEYDGNYLLNPDDSWDYEVNPLVVGTKTKIYEGEGWMPKISLMANLSIPLNRQDSVAHVAPSLYLLFQNDITEWFNVGYNVGLEWSGVTHVPSTFLALCLGFNISDNFGAFVESYNSFTLNEEAECNLDFGLTYLVHPKVQLDLYGMFNCQNAKSFNGVGLGVAWLLN